MTDAADVLRGCSDQNVSKHSDRLPLSSAIAHNIFSETPRHSGSMVKLDTMLLDPDAAISLYERRFPASHRPFNTTGTVHHDSATAMAPEIGGATVPVQAWLRSGYGSCS